jgi:hypothetical protein
MSAARCRLRFRCDRRRRFIASASSSSDEAGVAIETRVGFGMGVFISAQTLGSANRGGLLSNEPNGSRTDSGHGYRYR